MDDEKEVQRQLLAKWIAQRDNLDRLIEALQIELGEDRSMQTTISPQSGALSFSGSARPILLRPDEFFGMSQAEAAYVYLKKVGHAAHVEAMVEALRAGGVKFKGQDPKTTLYTTLVRGTRRFVLVSPGTFGLLEFYPERVKLKEEKKKPQKKKPMWKAAILPSPKKKRDRASDEQPDPTPQ